MGNPGPRTVGRSQSADRRRHAPPEQDPVDQVDPVDRVGQGPTEVDLVVGEPGVDVDVQCQVPVARRLDPFEVLGVVEGGHLLLGDRLFEPDLGGHDLTAWMASSSSLTGTNSNRFTTGAPRWKFSLAV